MGKKYLFNAIEGVFDIVAGEADYLQASLANDQTNISTNDNIEFDTVDESAGSSISLNTANGTFTLAPGKTYKLTCGIRFEHTDASKIGFKWYNITDSVGLSNIARLHNMFESGAYSNQPITQTIITPTKTTVISVRCTYEGGGVEDVNAGYTWAIVEKIAETIYNVAFTPSIVEENCLLGLSADQGALSNDTTINFVDNIAGKTVNNNISFNNTTHRVTLLAGKTYKLTASLRCWGNSTDDTVPFRWYDVTNSVYIGITGRTSANDATDSDGTSPTACAIITPSSNIEVEVRASSGVTGSPGVKEETAWATIEKISERLLSETEGTLIAITPTITGTTIGSGVGQVNPINFYKETITINGLTKVIVTGRFDHYQEDSPVTIDLSAHMSSISSATITPNDHLVYESMMGISIPTVNTVKINRHNDITGESICSVVIIGIE